MKNKILGKKLLSDNKNLYRSIHSKFLKETIQRVSSAINKNDFKIKKIEKKIAADIGCGKLGLGAINLINLGFRNIQLFDLNKKNVISAKKNILKNFRTSKIKLNITFKSGNLENFKFRNNFFDLVLCQGVLHHIEKDMSCIRNIYNSMKKKGIFLLTVQGKRGLVTNITYDVLARSYHSDKNIKIFFDKIFKKPIILKNHINFLKKNSDKNGKKFLDLFIKMANSDFMQTLEDRVKSKRYYQYTFKEIKFKLKKTGFSKISKIKKLSKIKYKNLRQIFNSLYINKNHNLSKIFFGNDSSHINLRIIK